MYKQVLALMLFWPLAALADFEVGLAAYERGDFETALREFQPLAEAGDARAQNNLGAMYFGGQGMAKDDVQAFAWASVAAAQGEKNAMVARDFLRENLMPVQLADAQQLSHELCARISTCTPDTLSSAPAADPSWWQRLAKWWQ